MRWLAGLLMITLLSASGCDDSSAAKPTASTAYPAIGSTCVVQFRRDALGGAAPLPVSPMTNSINGAEVSVAGKLVRFDNEWIVLARDTDELWIPRHNVLLVQADKR